jgi:O-antigen/teichoic acid export membrane protein
VRRLSRLEREAAIVMAASSVANVATYAYHLVISRHLGPARYGIVGAVLGVLVILALPAAGLQYSVARRTAAGDDGAASVRGALRLSLTVGVGLALLIAVSTPVSSGFLQTGVGPLLWLAAAIPGVVVAPVLLGYVQGRRQFGWLVASMLTLAATRLLGAVVVAVTGAGETAAVLAITMSTVLALGVVMLGTRDVLRPGPLPAGLVAEVGHTIVPFFGLALLAGMDVVFARHYLSETASGYYVAASVAGKIVLWAPAAVNLVAFPEFAAGGPDGAAALRRALALVAVVCTAALGAVTIFREQLIGTLFGSRFLPATNVVFVVAVAMSCLALIQVLATWSIARGDRLIGAILGAGTVAAAVLFVAFHDSPLEVAEALAMAIVATLAVVALRVVTDRERTAAPSPQ